MLFITTANVLDPVPPALRDRMEVLELPGYTEEEKLNIAREHLVEKQVANHGLTGEQIAFTDAALRAVIRGYTREAGVRNLEREIGSICRKAARRRAEGDESALAVTPDVVMRCSGRRDFSTRRWRSARSTRAWQSGWPGRLPGARCSSSRRRAWRVRGR